MRMDGSSDGYLVVCSYTIAVLDLISAVLFASISGMLYAQHSHWTSLAALIFSIAWMCIILILLLGIYRRQLNYVRYWLVFTCLGIMLDAILLLYGLTLAVSINWEGVRITLMPFVGLAVEMTFVYIIYIFYLDMIEHEQWIPLSSPRFKGGCNPRNKKETSRSSDTQRRERKRLRKMYKREEKAALKELQRKLHSLTNVVMQLEKDSLLYCAYAIAVFDLLCGVLFAALSLCKFFTHLSWLTIFAVCFGLFWLTLIGLLFTGIYRRKSDLVRYWLIFSCGGIFLETCLIIYAFLSESTFQIGLASNSLVLCLGLFVETIFAFIIYQFYQVVAKCSPCAQQTQQTPSCECQQPQPPPSPQPKPKPKSKPEPQVCPASTHKSSHSYRCHILQTRDYNSPYTCGPKRAVYKPFKLDERRSQR